MEKGFDRINAMGKVIIAKFSQNKDLAKRLLETKGEIVEENTWNDTFWGVCNGVGENKLGIMLARVREYLLKKAGERKTAEAEAKAEAETNAKAEAKAE